MATDGALIVQVRGDTAQLEKALTKSEETLRKFGEVTQKVQKYVSGFNVSLRDFTVIGIGLAQVKTYLQSLVGQFTAFGDILDKTSQRTGILASDLSKLKFAAEQCGGNFEALNIGLRDLFKNLQAAEMGDAAGLKNLAQLDLTPAILAGMSMKEKFLEVADALSKLNSDTQKVKIAMALFGEQGYKLLPLLKQGKAGIEALMEEADRLGIVFDDADVKNAAAMSDEINRLKTTLSDLTKTGIASIAPDLISGMEAVRGFAQAVSSLITPFRGLISTVFVATSSYVAFKGSLLIGQQAMNQWAKVVKIYRSVMHNYMADMRHWNRISSMMGRTLDRESMKAIILASRWKNLDLLWKKIILSVKGFFATLKASMMSNPVGWLMGIASAGILLYQMLAPATKELKSFSDAMQEAQAASAKTKEELQGYQAKMERLKALTIQERLTNKEKEESSRLVDQLNRQYPTLGLEIDKITSKLKNAGDAQARLNELQRKKMLVEKRQELAEAKRSKTETDEAVTEFYDAIHQAEKTTYDNMVGYHGNKRLAAKQAKQAKQAKYNELWTTGGWGRGDDYYKTAFKNKAQQDATIPLLEEEIRFLERGGDIFNKSPENAAVQGQEQRGNVHKFLEEKRIERLSDKEKELDKIAQKYQQLSKDVQESLNALETQKVDGIFPTRELEEEYQRLKNLQSSLDSLRGEEIVNVESKYQEQEIAHRVKMEQEAAQKRVKAAQEAAQKEMEYKAKIAQMENDFAAQSMGTTEKELAALREKNAEYLKLIQLLHGVESAEVRAAQAANEKRVREFVAKMSAEELTKAQPLLEKERRENDYFRLLADEKASQEQVQKAKTEFDKALEEYQKYSISQAKQKMEIAREEEEKTAGEYKKIKNDSSASVEEKAQAFDRWQVAKSSSEEARQNWIQQSDQAFQHRFQESKETVEARGSARGTFSAWEAGNVGVGDVLSRQLKEQKTGTELLREMVREMRRNVNGLK